MGIWIALNAVLMSIHSCEINANGRGRDYNNIVNRLFGGRFLSWSTRYGPPYPFPKIRSRCRGITAQTREVAING
jgi:hypothetical protein